MKTDSVYTFYNKFNISCGILLNLLINYLRTNFIYFIIVYFYSSLYMTLCNIFFNILVILTTNIYSLANFLVRLFQFCIYMGFSTVCFIKFPSIFNLIMFFSILKIVII